MVHALKKVFIMIRWFMVHEHLESSVEMALEALNY